MISKIDVVVQSEECCSVGCTGPTSNDSGMEEVRNISTHPSHSQLQERYRVPCVFRSTGWGVQILTIGEISGAMDLPPGPIMKTFSRVVEQSKVLFTSFLRLPPFKDLQFALEVGLGIGRTFRSSHNNNGLTPLPPVYTLRDENSFRINLQYIHKKAVNADDAEIETAVWNYASACVIQKVYMVKCHEPIFHHLRNIIAKRLKRNFARSFLSYMVDTYGP